MSKTKKPQQVSKERIPIHAPPAICLYDPERYEKTVTFYDDFEKEIFHNFNYVHIDLTNTTFISAAAALMLFAKITRCQCWAPKELFSNPDQIITISLPNHKETRKKIIDSGLWAAIKPGGQRKLDRLWNDWKNPYKTGSDPAKEIKDIISQLQIQFKPLPRHIVAAIQECYLNIAHHAYEEFKDSDTPLHEFMVGRWWQYARRNPITKKISVVIYDMGSGIPSTITNSKLFTNSDSDEIHKAMRTGVTRLKIQGRGMGFDNIKKPIEVNASAEYLVIYSGKGQVTYKRGQIVDRIDHEHGVGGTLIEWVFGEEEK
jgi:hypothetical protein